MISEEILILHTNDMHSHLEHWPRVRRFIFNKKRQAARQGMQSFIFDIGDAIDRQHPLTEASFGQANIKLMNDIGYHAVTVGNNELLGLNHDQLNHLYDDANFPVVLANIIDAQTQSIPKWAFKYQILETAGHQKIAVFGLTAPFIRTLPLLDWLPEAVDKAIENLLPELQAQADTVILLSHLGLPTDRHIAEAFPEIQLILGAHTHHLLPKGEMIGQTMLAAAGRYGDHVGTVKITLTDGRVAEMYAQTYATADMAELPEDAEEIENYQLRGEKKLQAKQIATLPETYHADMFSGEPRLIDLGLDSVQSMMQTDIAMLSTGLFSGDLPAGVVTADDLHQILPHAVHPMRTRLVGHELERLIKEITKTQVFLKNYQIRGMGFRGHQAFGDIVWRGLEIDDNNQIWINGALLDQYRYYTVGSLDHYLFIPFFPTLEIAGENELNYAYVLREVVAQYLTEHFS